MLFAFTRKVVHFLRVMNDGEGEKNKNLGKWCAHTWGGETTLSEPDQTLSEVNRTTSELNQTTSEVEKTTSEVRCTIPLFVYHPRAHTLHDIRVFSFTSFTHPIERQIFSDNPRGGWRMLAGAILHPQRFEKQRERCSGEGLKDKNHTYSVEYACARSRPPKESSQGLARC